MSGLKPFFLLARLSIKRSVILFFKDRYKVITPPGFVSKNQCFFFSSKLGFSQGWYENPTWTGGFGELWIFSNPNRKNPWNLPGKTDKKKKVRLSKIGWLQLFCNLVVFDMFVDIT